MVQQYIDTALQLAQPDPPSLSIADDVDGNPAVRSGYFVVTVNAATTGADIAGLNVQLGDGTTFTPPQFVPHTARHLVFLPATPITQYVVRVTAFNQLGSAASDIRVVTTDAAPIGAVSITAIAQRRAQELLTPIPDARVEQIINDIIPVDADGDQSIQLGPNDYIIPIINQRALAYGDVRTGQGNIGQLALGGLQAAQFSGIVNLSALVSSTQQAVGQITFQSARNIPLVFRAWRIAPFAISRLVIRGLLGGPIGQTLLRLGGNILGPLGAVSSLFVSFDASTEGIIFVVVFDAGGWQIVGVDLQWRLADRSDVRQPAPTADQNDGTGWLKPREADQTTGWRPMMPAAAGDDTNLGPRSPRFFDYSPGGARSSPRVLRARIDTSANGDFGFRQQTGPFDTFIQIRARIRYNRFATATPTAWLPSIVCNMRDFATG